MHPVQCFNASMLQCSALPLLKPPHCLLGAPNHFPLLPSWLQTSLLGLSFAHRFTPRSSTITPVYTASATSHTCTLLQLQQPPSPPSYDSYRTFFRCTVTTVKDKALYPNIHYTCTHSPLPTLQPLRLSDTLRLNSLTTPSTQFVSFYATLVPPRPEPTAARLPQLCLSH